MINRIVPTDHRQTTIKIRDNEVSIDDGIMWFVLWLNKLDSVETYSSCEGGNPKKKKSWDLPYVSFTCSNPNDLSDILWPIFMFMDETDYNIDINVTYLSKYQSKVIYVIYFPHRRCMKKLRKWMGLK